MGWFDEQIRQRKKSDNQVLEDSFNNIASAVLQRRVLDSNDDSVYTQDAVELILNYYGCKTVELPQEIKDFNEQLEYLCRPHGIMRRNIKLTKGWYKDAFGALLGFYKENHKPVALVPGTTHGYCFIKDGKTYHVNSNNEDLFEKDAYCFYKPLPLKKISTVDLLKYCFETRTVFDNIYIIVLLGVTTLIGLLTPKLTNFLMNNVVADKRLDLLISTLIFMFCVSVSSSLFQVVNNIYNERVNTKMSVYVQAATMMRVLSLPASFFKKYASGDLNQRVSYVSSLASTLMNAIFSTGLTSLFSLAYITSIFEYAPTLVVPSLIIIISTLACSLISTMIMMKRSLAQMKLSSKESGMSYSMIVGIQKIRLAGAEKRAFARWGNLYAKEAWIEYKPQYVTLISTAISLIGTIVMYYMAVKANVSVADYYAFNAAYAMVSGAFASMVSIVVTVSNIKPTLEMAKPILDAEPEIAEGKQVLTRIQGGIELNNVSFRYDDNMPLIVDQMNLKIKPGQYVAIVGKTGCGKSTIIRLLLGFEKPQRGSIYYDGHDVQSVDLKSLRRKIGVVMQDGKLFQGDIFSNIAISSPSLTLDEAWEAAETAGIADDIRRMPMGMNTVISEGSGGISGGQRQRIMIARAIASKPRILIFDEATSALDNITQKKISEALDKLKCTRIVIAHRLSTIKHCDRILYLEGGKILEDGTYDELIKLNGKFAELVERQRLDNGESDNNEGTLKQSEKVKVPDTENSSKEDNKMIEKVFDAKNNLLHDVLAFTEGELEKHGCDTKTLMMISVMIEEIFVNIASYAYPDGGGTATIGLEFEGDDVIVSFTDSGIPFNPLAKEDPDITLSAEERGIGGLGIYMVKKTMDDVKYERRGNQNFLSFRKGIH